MAIYESRVASIEQTAMSLTQELIARGFENPRTTAEYLRIVASCAVMLSDPREYLSDGLDPRPGASASQF